MQKQISWKQNSYPSSSCDKRSWIERVSERVRERGSDGGKKGIMQSYTNIIVFPRCTQMQRPKPDRIAYLRESTHTHKHHIVEEKQTDIFGNDWSRCQLKWDLQTIKWQNTDSCSHTHTHAPYTMADLKAMATKYHAKCFLSHINRFRGTNRMFTFFPSSRSVIVYPGYRIPGSIHSP